MYVKLCIRYILIYFSEIIYLLFDFNFAIKIKCNALIHICKYCCYYID